MVAAKYCRKEALAGLIGDRRVDLDTRDSGGRRVEEVVAVAVTSADQVDKTDIMDYVARERLGRVEEEGRRDSMEEESIDVDDMHKLRVYSQVKELLGELRGLHQMDRVKLIAEQEAESHQFVAKLEQDFVAFLERQRLEQTHFFNKVSSIPPTVCLTECFLQVLNDKKEFDVRQQEGLNRLVKRQEQETCSLQASTNIILWERKV